MFKLIRSLALIIALIAVIILSFWISFLIGNKMLVPIKKIPTQYLITDEAKLELPPEISLEVEGLTFESGALVAKKPAVKKEIPARKQIVRGKPVSAKGAYTVQLGSFSRRANAEALINDLKKKGFVGRLIISGKWFRVDSGSFNSLAPAHSQQKKLSAAGFAGIVRRDD
jgi:hypothetical protein